MVRIGGAGTGTAKLENLTEHRQGSFISGLPFCAEMVTFSDSQGLAKDDSLSDCLEWLLMGMKWIGGILMPRNGLRGLVGDSGAN